MLVSLQSTVPLLVLISLPYIFTDDDDSNDDHDYESSEIDPPKVSVSNNEVGKHWENDWEILDMRNGAINIVARHNHNTSLNLLCTAPKAILWMHNSGKEFSIQNNEARQCTQFSKNVNGTRLHSKTLLIRIPSNVTSKLITARCEYEANWVNTKINIFVPGEKVLFNSGKNLTYGNNDDWIQCPTSNPKIPVLLLREDINSGYKTEVVNQTYDPTKGFPLTEKIIGIYICYANENDSIRFLPEESQINDINIIPFYNITFPQIKIVNGVDNNLWQNDWEAVYIENNETNIVAKHNNEKRLQVLCTAAQEVEWQFESTDENNIDDISDCDNFPIFNNGTLFYSRMFSISFPSDIKDLFILKCEYRDNNYGSKINVFIPGGENKPFIHNGEILKYSEDDEYIKCPTTDPRTPVHLLFEDPETGFTSNVKNVTYIPTRGFKLDKKQGVYICYISENITLRFEQNEQRFKNITFVIKLKDVSTHCKETDFNTILVIHGGIQNKNEIRSTIIEENSNQIIWIEKDTTTLIDLMVKTMHDRSPIVDIFCVQDDLNPISGMQRGKVLNKWSIGPIFETASNKFNQLDESYFIGLNKGTLKGGKLNWEHFRVDENIFMVSDGGNTMYVNETSTFICKTASKEANLTFWMVLLDGTKVALKNGAFNSVKLEVDERDFLQFKTWTLSLQLPLQAVAIHCQISYAAHPTLYLGAERHFRTVYLSPPKISNIEMDNSKLIYVGEIHQKLICQCRGEPQPKYTWIKDNKKLPKELNLRSTIDQNGNSILEFPSITKHHEGTYICSAVNRIGSDIFSFMVSVKDNLTPTDDLSTKLITIVGVIMTLLIAAVICGFGIYQYHTARTLMRGLTDQEIQEFFIGRPELAKSFNNLSFAGDFDALPYNNTFEIDVCDTILDYQSILGSGEFAIVIKGFLKSKDTQVAVKVAKTTTDVTLFKSLLSEVKILSYIGTHANVTGLVGVTTTDIQNRNLYIYMDLCELGSLEKYLRSNKHQYLNLIDENQKINRNTIQFQNDSLNGNFSTLDLIRWSSEIASGMEYLTQKSIVHADLAARNVLLTRDKSARVSDFGMSKKLYECSLYVKKTKCPLPWRWMALESLKTLTFSIESDVWSYGVTLWEIFTLGDIPFPNETWNTNFVDMLTCGIRMGKPKHSTSEIYSKTVECWDEHPSKRPQFSTLRNYFSKLYDSLVSSGVYEHLTEDDLQS